MSAPARNFKKDRQDAMRKSSTTPMDKAVSSVMASASQLREGRNTVSAPADGGADQPGGAEELAANDTVDSMEDWLHDRHLDSLMPRLRKLKVDGRALLSLRELAADEARFLAFAQAQLQLRSGEALALYFELVQRVTTDRDVLELSMLAYNSEGIASDAQLP